MTEEELALLDDEEREIYEALKKENFKSIEPMSQERREYFRAMAIETIRLREIDPSLIRISSPRIK